MTGTRSVQGLPIRHRLYREPFRPFCICAGRKPCEYFDNSYTSPFSDDFKDPADQQAHSAFTHPYGAGTCKRSKPPSLETDPQIGEISGVPVLLNISFNKNELLSIHPSRRLIASLRTQTDVAHRPGGGRPADGSMGAPGWQS
jgi:predicted NodU family carbamoyl transferase